MGWYRRFVNALRSNRVSTDIEREMEFHMAERTDDLIAHGLTEAEAKREARRRFGNPSLQKERTRDADVLTWLESLGADVRYALRALRASPVFAVVTITSLGLGIGANTAIFSLIDAVVLKSLPVERPEELVQLTWKASTDGIVTNPIWEQIRDRQHVFSGVFAYAQQRFNLTTGGEVRRAMGNHVSGDYFSTLGVRPAVGRLISRADDVRGCPAVAVLGYGFWQNEYGGSPNAIGRTIMVERTPHTIIGVTDPGFFGVEVGRSVQVYAPLCTRSDLDERSIWYLKVIGRPKHGVTLAQIVAHLEVISPAVFASTLPPGWGTADKERYLKRELAARPAPKGFSPLRNEYQTALTVLMAVVGLVLLIACANVANLLLARAAARQREMAIRLAIGAGRGRLVRQLLTESILLATLGAAMGILFARWGSALLVGVLARGPFPVSLDLAVDGRVLAFTVAVAVATGLLFGLAPAWRSTRVDPQGALKANGRGVVTGQTRWSIGRVLVVGQIALSLVLVIGAGLLLGTFRTLATMDPGFRREGVLVVSVNLGDAGYAPESYGTVRRDLLARFRALPGVQAASVSLFTPISGSAWNDEIRVDGFTPVEDHDSFAYFNQVSEGFFTAMGTPLLAGRDFDERDRVGSIPVAIVNETMARRFFKGGNPVGKYYRLVMPDSLGAPIQIVGVAKDAKYIRLREETLPTIYLPIEQETHPGQYAEYELRSTGAAESLRAAVKASVAGVNRAIALELTTLSRQVDRSLTRERLLATLSAFFGGLAVLLATIGLYGTLAYSVARRRNEIGIRMALGAAQRRVVGLVLSEVARMVALGLVLGAVAAMVSTRWVTSFLYGLSPSDPGTVSGAAALLALVALAAGAIPAWRASRVDPIAALRED